MANNPTVYWYYKAWLVATAGWDADIVGWYSRLLSHQADKYSLPGDLESLAELAGVKISQYDRFKLSWELKLKHKFKLNPDGTVYNPRMRQILDTRDESSDSQSQRGIIGSLIKKARKLCTLNEQEEELLIEELKKIDWGDLSIKEREAKLKAKLEAKLKAFKVTVTVPVKGTVPVTVTKQSLFEEFEEFRKLYPGRKRGGETEYENFSKKHKDFKQVVPLLHAALDSQFKQRAMLESKGKFIPEWKNLQTWINQRCWEEELNETTGATQKKTFNLPKE